jgi:hypothetical protein
VTRGLIPSICNAFSIGAPHQDMIAAVVMEGWANVLAFYSMGCTYLSYARFLLDRNFGAGGGGNAVVECSMAHGAGSVQRDGG